MEGKRIDVAQIIANEMRNVAEIGKEFGAGTKTTCPLVFRDLIIGLLIASRVRIPNVVHFKIKTKPDLHRDTAHQMMTPEVFQSHIAWPRDTAFNQRKVAGHGDENEEEEEAEPDNEEGTSGGSKMESEASDDENMREE
ncbi:unnamed protein product [Vicia faba]|uniref:Uncharacterized protein n=1 Tax=Vicia faba TaxID=3906 RepID=A0AAV0ZV04_VICFA|nr:unnamed protein product [Vicia faba]